MEWCPHCNQPYVKSPHSGDFVHNCNSGQDDLDKESVLIRGTWEDSDGTSGGPNTEQIVRAGQGNKLVGRIGAKYIHLDEKDIFGKNKSVHRLRKHFEYIK